MPNYLDQEGLGYYDGKMKVYMSNAISSAVAATYKPGGSRTFEQLPSLVAEYVGFIYNITNDFTTTSDFVEGAGTFCKAGANVGIVNVGTNQSPVYKYDLFSAFVDLSNYATLDDLPTKTSDLTNDSGYASAFTGTTAQWNALTDAQKAKYELVCLTDDLGDSDNVKDLMVNKAQATVIARQDEATTASRSYVIGDLVYRGNILYKVIAPIASGNSFVVGTNISTTTIETELSNKVDKVAGKGLSTNDYDNTEKDQNEANAEAIEAIVNRYGSKNLAPNNATNITESAYQFTVNSDKSITINKTGNMTQWGIITLAENFLLKAGKYFLSTGTSEYKDNAFLEVIIDGVKYGTNYGSDGTIYLELQSDKLVTLRARIFPDSTTFNVTLYPMIRDARIKDPTYVPYAMTNAELTRAVDRGSVSVTADGVKTYAQILSDLHSLIDISKVSQYTTKFVRVAYTSNNCVPLVYKNNTDHLQFCGVDILYNNELYIDTYSFKVQDNIYTYKEVKFSNSGNVITDRSSDIPAAGTLFTVYY